MKKMLAIATVAALLGGGSAFAADSGAVRLDDAQMDGLTAGAKSTTSTNNVIIVPITTVDADNIAIALGDGATATVNSTIVINNTIYVIQYIGGGGGNGKLYAQAKKLDKSISPKLAKKLG